MSNVLKFLRTRLPIVVMMAFALPLMRPVVQATPLPHDLQMGLAATLVILGLVFGGYEPEREHIHNDAPRKRTGLHQLRLEAVAAIRSALSIGGLKAAIRLALGAALILLIVMIGMAAIGQLVIVMTLADDLIEGAGSAQIIRAIAWYGAILAATIAVGAGTTTLAKRVLK